MFIFLANVTPIIGPPLRLEKTLDQLTLNGFLGRFSRLNWGDRGREGGQKPRKMRRRRLWMVPYLFYQSFQTNFAKVESLLGSEDGNNNSLANVLRDTESNIIGKFSIFRNKALL